ncbi:MAG TPA: ferrochelatase [Candidatus Limnocylindrales bacterium]|nr:ferrochelatase [Candidatus Limnocylindrales bacterium]
MTGRSPRAVLLMTYGSPASLDDIDRYLAAVRGGRSADPALVEEFRRRYRVIGGSPLIERTREQASALEQRLGDGTIVRAAMRFSEPSIDAVVHELAGADVQRAAGIVLSPQFSPLLMGGYGQAVETARAAIGPGAPDVAIAGPWHREPAFVEALGARIRDALLADGAGGVGDPVLLTAHSLPLRVAEREPDYLDQLRETAELAAAAAALADGQWTFCWQSAGHEPGEWMAPDFADLMPRLRAAGHRRVVVAPVQFLADHLEILYDIDVGARQQAEAVGLAFRRTASLNDDPGLVNALAAVARRALEHEGAAAPP